MSAVGGFVSGVIGLSLLEAVVSSDVVTGRVGGAFTGAANLVRHVASADVPAIPDLRIPASQRPRVTPGPLDRSTPAPSGADNGGAVTSFTAPASRLPVSA